MEARVATNVIKLTRIQRGVKDAGHSAQFYSWLLGLEPEQEGDSVRLACANGELLLHKDVSTPIAFELDGDGPPFRGRDPDGVPLAIPDTGAEFRSGTVTLDHVRLNCGDLAAAVIFYRQLGFIPTWADGPNGETLIGEANHGQLAATGWVHLSAADGYLSLSQADWQTYGAGLPGSGPPRFIHIGFAVRDLENIAGRLDAAGISYWRPQRSPLGRQLYLNDPDGIETLGKNVELFEYEPGVPRSGKLPGA